MRSRIALASCAASIATFVFLACGEEAETPRAEPESPIDPQPEEVEEPEGDALAGMRVHLDLLALAHLADVDHHGLYVDFGTPARTHYTMGRWHNGFLSDAAAGERDFTRMGSEARLYLHSDDARVSTLRIRGRAIGASTIVVNANGERAGQIALGEGVQDHDVRVPLRAGENTILLRADATRTVGGEEVAAEIDSMWALPETVPENIAAPRYAELVREHTVGGEARRAIVVRGPTRVRFYAEIPEGGRLVFGAGGRGSMRVTVAPEGGEASEVFSGEAGDRWRDRSIDLARFSGQVVRIEFASDADMGWSGPAIAVPLPEQALSAAQAPSVIVLLVDTLRANKLRPYNPRTRVQTPMMDEFAAQAAVFEHAQSPENWTKPSVASILTSLTPTTHNTKSESASLPPSALMLSEIFQDAGFATASFIANGYVSDRFGFNQGWDHYTNYIREERRTAADQVFREAIEWIEAHREERFFAYVHTIDPHVPYDPPDDILRIYDPDPYTGPISPRRTGLQLEDVKLGRLTLAPRDVTRLMALYDGEITYHDRQLAIFVERLRALGLYDRVIFVVTSDHGEEFNEHGSFGHGHSVYQELLHVPLMVRWHGVIDPLRIGPTVSTLDIAPTVLEATGVPIPEVFEGQSLLATARGHLRPGPAIAFSDKLDDRRVATAAGYKLVVRGNLTWSFFDLRSDPGEARQIDDPSRYPIALRYLRGAMGQFLGAADRGDWLHAGTGQSRVLPQAESQIDAEMCRQLRALGYLDARCDDIL